ncbi:hypothetical protein M569_03905 [Genlisea aurea]|uniref:Sulfite exporter TauE/SafE family protein n=1 Tax=Genlisea aurea TaxID=192259 RepID=S8CVM8_9LAMI|nr:hypothetical protein M569_03905 [Genlisea aurea]
MAANTESWSKSFAPFFSLLLSFLCTSLCVSAERSLMMRRSFSSRPDSTVSLSPADDYGYQHVWPDFAFNWRLVVGSIIGFLGAAFGSVGGVGGGGIFVPMLTLIIGFDAKSATAISKCMIMGAAASTVHYNLKLKHPTLDMPIIDYDLAVLIQPMLMLGTSTKSFLKGVETWKKETITIKEAENRLKRSGGDEEAESMHLTGKPSNSKSDKSDNLDEPEVSVLENVRWNELRLLFFVWFSFLAVQIIKNYTPTCSAIFWFVNLLQIPVSVGVSGYEAVRLYLGWKRIGSKVDDETTTFKPRQLVIYCSFGIVAGVVGGLLGIGGGFIMGPLFLELGVPPQVSSATATFIMMFSASMSVVEYHLLNRFPVPYALYLFVVATIAAYVGQHVVRRIIAVMGRASIIIFVLSFTIFVSAVSLGGFGISKIVAKIRWHEYMGFGNLCKY